MGSHGEPVEEENVIVLFGACCCNLGLYVKNCFGIASESTVLCLDHSCCLKLGADPIWCALSGNDKQCCRIGLGCCGLGLVWPSTICKNQGQVCCIVSSCAFPNDEEIPATCAVLGLACLPYCGCCIRLKQARAAAKRSAGGPPAPENTIEAVQGETMAERNNNTL